MAICLEVSVGPHSTRVVLTSVKQLKDFIPNVLEDEGGDAPHDWGLVGVGDEFDVHFKYVELTEEEIKALQSEERQFEGW